MPSHSLVDAIASGYIKLVGPGLKIGVTEAVRLNSADGSGRDIAYKVDALLFAGQTTYMVDGIRYHATHDQATGILVVSLVGEVW